MKRPLFLIILALSWWTRADAGNFVYPFDQVSVPKCRFSAWSTLGSDCKMTLPRIQGAEYAKYSTDKDMRKIYSILWGATYTYGWDV